MKTAPELKVLAFQEDALLAGRPMEDIFAYDSDNGVFVVADGVSLWEDIEYVGRYPKRSGSARLSRVFCKEFVDYLSHHPQADIKKGFIAGNTAAAEVNKDRSKYDVFSKHRGLYAATAAMVHIREKTLEWAHICDAGIVVIGKNGDIKLRREGCSHSFQWPHDTRNYGVNTWTFFARTIVRNAMGHEGQRLGYGVITGEPEAVHYLETGKRKLVSGDVVVIYSDGFAPYFSLAQFRKILATWESSQELERKIMQIIEKKTAWLSKELHGNRIDLRASHEVITNKLKKILGKRFKEVEWGKEKTLIAIKI